MPDDAPFRTRVSTKGQVVLPKVIRERLRWEAGAELVVEQTPDGVVLKRTPLSSTTRYEDVAGCLHRPGMRAVSVEEMNTAVEAEVKRRHARGRY